VRRHPILLTAVLGLVGVLAVITVAIAISGGSSTQLRGSGFLADNASVHSESGHVAFGCNLTGLKQSSLHTATVTTSSGSVIRCAQGKSLYADMVANGTAYGAMVQMLSAYVDPSGTTPGYVQLMKVGVPEKLARKLASQIINGRHGG
jgi:hypothetical protein